MDKNDNEEIDPSRPVPTDFDAYLPWACQQFSLDSTINIERIIQQDYISSTHTDRSKSKSKAKAIQSRTEMTSDIDKDDKSRLNTYVHGANVVKIFAVYDTHDNLVEIKFERNRKIPRLIIKVVTLIVKFHPYLTVFKINRGLDQYVLYELCKCLIISNITDVCLDDTFVREANYEILLEKQTPLKHLSLARCRINDEVLANITSMLIYPLPGSKMLRTLNLASNRISDVGAKYIANVLRSNRSLCYLNLADNRITDIGASSILNILQPFPMTCEEIMAGRGRLMNFLKEKSELVKKIIVDLKAGDYDKKPKRKSTRPATSSARKGKVEKEASLKSFAEMDGKSLINMEVMYLEKAETIADGMLGDFADPFSKTDTILKDGIPYCSGNNSVHYLNLAYNDISFFTVKQLLKVVSEQKYLDKKPRGLINVNIEGNNIPIHCKELSDLDELLEIGLMVHSKRMSALKKKTVSKSGK